MQDCRHKRNDLAQHAHYLRQTMKTIMPVRSFAVLLALLLVVEPLWLTTVSAESDDPAGEGGILVAKDGAPSLDRNSSSSSNASDLKSKCEKYRSRMFDEDSFSDAFARERGASYYARVNDLESTCPSRASNAHGTYTSKGNCYFTFHAIHSEDKVPVNRMSVACAEHNAVGDESSDLFPDDAVRHPVKNWPDACVGDYARCYRLDHDEDKLLKFICSKKLEVPEGATHLSVDCTSDKATLQEMQKRGDLDEDLLGDPVSRRQEKERRDHYAFVVTMSVAFCAFVSVCLLLAHRYAFQPYLKALKRSRSDPELFGMSSRQSSLTRP
jgi:hypothetical protein